MTSTARPIDGTVSASTDMARLIRTVLTHPLAMRLKRAARGIAWRVKGAGVENPALPPRVERVLFVCLGNICRSPFGALLADRILNDGAGGRVACASAGVRPSQAARSPEAACAAAAPYGVSLDEHVPQLLTRELIGAHDVVMVMEAAQLDDLRASYPEYQDRIFLLALYDEQPGDAYERCNIADPFGQPQAAFEACYARIERAVRAWSAAVTAAGTSAANGR